MPRITSLTVLQHLFLLTHAAFDMSAYPRVKKKVCDGDTFPLDCQSGEILWVHEVISAVTLFTVHDNDHGVYICVEGKNDYRHVFSGTEAIFRASSSRPFYVRPNGKMRCLPHFRMEISYMLVYHSCIQDALLNPVNMLSATTRVASTAHIQLLQTSDYYGIPNEATCHIRPNDLNNSVMTLTITLVYADLPRTSPCGQKLWAENQDNAILFSLCSPQWFRQRVVYEGNVNWVTLHFRSPTQPVRMKRDWINTDPKAPPSLFIWMYIQASATFTIACGEQSMLPTTAHTDPVSSLALTEPTPGERRWSVTPSSPADNFLQLASRAPQTLSARSTASSQSDVKPVTASPTLRTSFSMTTPISITQAYTNQELSSKLLLKGTSATIEAEPNTAGDATFGAVTHTEIVVGQWKIAAVCMSVVIVVIIFAVGIVEFRRAQRRKQQLREEEMLYHPDGFNATPPNQEAGLNMSALTAGVPDRAFDETVSNISDPSYASLHF